MNPQASKIDKQILTQGVVVVQKVVCAPAPELIVKHFKNLYFQQYLFTFLIEKSLIIETNR